MKKTTAILLGTLIASSAAFAQSNVLSRNAVGYVKVTVEPSKLSLVRFDFEPMSADGNVITNIVGDLPQGSQVLLWNAASQEYTPIAKTRSGWPSTATNRINRGDSFFVFGASTIDPAGYDMYLMGEVPDGLTAPTSTVNLVSGLSMAGYPYPVSVNWTNTSIAQQAVQGDEVLTWDSGSQSYTPNSRTRSGWSNPGMVLEPGQGFWFRNSSGSTINWNEVKPYTWP